MRSAFCVAGLLLGCVALSSAAVATIVAADPDVEVKFKKSDGAGFGSGVYVGNGIVVTAGHFVVDAAYSPIKVTLDRGGRKGESIEANPLWVDKEANDTAALRLATIPDDLKSAGLACRAPVIGEPIEVVGNPVGVTFIHTWGHVAGVMRGVEDTPWSHAVPIDASIASGNSGGPVYDAHGDVLGLVVGAITAGEHGVGVVNIATSAITICDRLAKDYVSK